MNGGKKDKKAERSRPKNDKMVRKKQTVNRKKETKCKT